MYLVVLVQEVAWGFQQLTNRFYRPLPSNQNIIQTIEDLKLIFYSMSIQEERTETGADLFQCDSE